MAYYKGFDYSYIPIPVLEHNKSFKQSLPNPLPNENFNCNIPFFEKINNDNILIPTPSNHSKNLSTVPVVKQCNDKYSMESQVNNEINLQNQMEKLKNIKKGLLSLSLLFQYGGRFLLLCILTVIY